MKTALVTGATRGIGKTIALKLASLQYDLIIVGRSKQRLKEVEAAIVSLGRRCLALEADLSREDIPEKLIRDAVTHFGQLDVLINNAGLAQAGPVAEITPEHWNKIFAINARAPFFLCQAAIPVLKESPNPLIINIGSVVDFKGYINQSVYASSKHALAGFTKVLAKEVQPEGIKVHLISPGGVNTEMVRQTRPDINAGELIQPEEIAEIVSFLVTRKGKGTIDHFYIRRQSGLAFD